MEALAFSLLFPWGDPKWELRNFPTLECCKHALDFNEAYRQHLLQARAFYGAEHPGWLAWVHVWNERGWRWHQEALAETWELRQCWETLQYARAADELRYQRLHLDALRGLIGERRYRWGWMPPAAPTWRFNEN